MLQTIWLEITLNRLLRLDPRYAELLEPLAGKEVALDRRPGGGRLLLTIGNAAVRVVKSRGGEAPDLIISAYPHQMLTLIGRGFRSPEQWERSGILVEGDQQLAWRLAETLAKLEPDWQEALASVVGDMLAYRAGLVARCFSAYGKRVRRNLSETLGDYVKYELDLAAGREEVSHLYEQIDRLRAEVAELKQQD